MSIEERRAWYFTLIQGCTHYGCIVTQVTKFLTAGSNFYGPSIWNLICHPSGAQNFELAPRVFENIRTAALMYYVETDENNRSVRPKVRIKQNLYFISQGIFFLLHKIQRGFVSP